jgi:hypothetical protein
VLSRRFQVAIACGAASGLAVAGSFGPLVRYQAGRVAERYGASLAIERVVPTLHGAKLHGVAVTLGEVPSASIRLEEVEVGYGWGGRRVALRGGLISAVGPRQVVVAEAEAWRGRIGGRTSNSGGAGSGGSTEISGLRLEWRDSAEGTTESVRAADVQLERQGGRTRVAAKEATVALGVATMSVVDGVLEVARREDGGYRVAELSARELDAELRLPTPPAPPAAPEAEPDADPLAPPPPLPRPRSAEPAASPPSPGRGEQIRLALVEAARATDSMLEHGARVELAGVRARVRRGDEVLNLGPGSLRVERQPGRLVVELSPGAGDARDATAERGQALTFRLAVPLDPAGEPPGEVVADVRGGPIWLSTIGVRDGDFGLLEVGKTSLEMRAHVALSPDGRRLSVDGEGKVHRLSLRSAALSDQPVVGLEIAWRGKGDAELDGSRIRVDEGEVDVGAVRLIANGEYERAGSSHRLRGEFEVPLTPCQSMLESVPRGLAPKLAGMRMAGSFAIKGRAKLDTANLDRHYDVHWDTSNTCRITEVPPEIDVERFQGPFRRTAYSPEGEPTEIEVGPETDGWLPLRHISRFMEVAVLTTEDGGFFRHRGFDEEAIRNSIRENLRSRKFVRGASTISMQTAKNVYLDRKKNLSRKLQEAVLTMYLEQALTKEQILELYLNVIEMGPMVYGIGPAARHYFNTSAGELSLGQALYISSILPSPKKQHFGPGGVVTPNWTGYMRKLMEIASKRKRITEEELEVGLRETVVRGSPSPHRAPPADETSEATLDLRQAPH